MAWCMRTGDRRGYISLARMYTLEQAMHRFACAADCAVHAGDGQLQLQASCPRLSHKVFFCSPHAVCAPRCTSASGGAAGHCHAQLQVLWQLVKKWCVPCVTCLSDFSECFRAHLLSVHVPWASLAVYSVLVWVKCLSSKKRQATQVTSLRLAEEAAFDLLYDFEILTRLMWTRASACYMVWWPGMLRRGSGT